MCVSKHILQNCPYKTLKNDFRNTLTHLLSMHCYALSANGSASKHYDAVKQSLFWAVQPDFSGTIKTEIRMNEEMKWQDKPKTKTIH